MIEIIKHPLIQDKLTRMRKTKTKTVIFRQSLFELTQLLMYEATKNLAVREIEIETPVVQNAKGYKLRDEVQLVAILRAGLGMVDAAKELIPSAPIGHVGLYRNEATLAPVEYYFKMPKTNENATIFVLDPMLATGGSAIATIDLLKQKCQFKKIVFVGIVGCPEGIKALSEAHPDIDIYLASCDEKLNEKGYIVPGLGDAGDRIFGTK